jgi:XisI protein
MPARDRYHDRELMEVGVSKDRIVLAFRSLEMRKLSDFAIA